MQNLAIGSHIKTSRTGYSHHGIYCGNGQVVHYSGFAQALKKGALEITTLQGFLDGESKYYVIEYPSNKVRFSSEEIARRALDRVGEDRYNLVFNNCEHFAAWCVTGKSESRQVKAVLSLTTTTAMVYRSISKALVATQIVGLTAGPTATSSLAIGKLTGCATGALGGTAAIGSTGMLVGSSTALGFSAAIGGGALTVAAAPAIVPVALAVGACAVVGGFLGSFFD